MRLIDACALQEEYKAQHSGKRLLLIDVAPTVDAVPVRRGKWKRWEDDWDGDDTFECSVCGAAFTLIDGTPEGNDYYYCPHCGARMEASDD